MEMNITKTKEMIVSKKETVPEIKINIKGENIQQVKEMIYLGFMAPQNINIRGRLSLNKCYIWSTSLY